MTKYYYFNKLEKYDNKKKYLTRERAEISAKFCRQAGNYVKVIFCPLCGEYN